MNRAVSKIPAPDPFAKGRVHDFWERAACGEELYLREDGKEGYLAQARERYRLEPYIPGFARFEQTTGKDVLEVGVGLGADHQRFAEAGARLHGIDLTERAIAHTRERLAIFGLSSHLVVGDAEALPFADASFDVVYSWGVIHHSPDTRKAASEILRVLRAGGRFSVMIYNRHSLVGYMLWLRYGLLRGRLLLPLDAIYANYLESPGTKAYNVGQARDLFPGANGLVIRSVLTHGDLLEGAAGQRHRGRILAAARRIWPRWAFRKLTPGNGLFMLIEGYKSG